MLLPEYAYFSLRCYAADFRFSPLISPRHAIDYYAAICHVFAAADYSAIVTLPLFSPRAAEVRRWLFRLLLMLLPLSSLLVPLMFSLLPLIRCC